MHFASARRGHEAAQSLQIATLGSRGEAKDVKDMLRRLTED